MFPDNVKYNVPLFSWKLLCPDSLVAVGNQRRQDYELLPNRDVHQQQRVKRGVPSRLLGKPAPLSRFTKPHLHPHEATWEPFLSSSEKATMSVCEATEAETEAALKNFLAVPVGEPETSVGPKLDGSIHVKSAHQSQR